MAFLTQYVPYCIGDCSHQFGLQLWRCWSHQGFGVFAKVADKSIDGDYEAIRDGKTGTHHGAQMRGFRADPVGIRES